MHSDAIRAAAEILFPHFTSARPVDWEKEFSCRRPLHIEIGFGDGEFLIRSVLSRPEACFIGIELDWGRIQKCFRRIARLDMSQQQEIFSRLRILRADAWTVFERLVRPRMVRHIECLFPCPWPKDRHERHRLFSPEFLRLINSRLEDSGTLRVVTDHEPYASWIREHAGGTGMVIDIGHVPAGFDTKFERKWRAGGQEVFSALRFKKGPHQDIPVVEDVIVKAYYHQHFDPEKFQLEKDVSAGVAVIPKETVFDREQEKYAVRVVVSEPHLTQNVWIGIVMTRKGWCVLRMEGQQVLPTDGVARAIARVSEAVARTES
ncbi:MAG: tRNA (guanine(46)-N(7))-methyltransferase TrmB [Candidatus Omnitrophota bacterium]